MAYTINKTDGTILATVADGQIDELSTDLTLVGKNYSGFGESINENFVKLLENFSSSRQPTRPIRGQIWFDVSELKLKVYSGTGFVPVSSATISNQQPLNLGVGDLWFNDLAKQLKESVESALNVQNFKEFKEAALSRPLRDWYLNQQSVLGVLTGKMSVFTPPPMPALPVHPPKGETR